MSDPLRWWAKIEGWYPNDDLMTDAEVLAEMGTEALMRELQRREVLWRAYWCDTHKQPADSKHDETCELVDCAPALWFGPGEADDE